MANIQSGTDGAAHVPLASARLTVLDWVAMALLIIGGLNWGLVGLFEFDLVASIFGVMTAASRAVYVIVGLCAAYAIYLCVRKLPARA